MNLASQRTRRNNIHRNRKLVTTPLSDIEREFVERRLSAEQAAAEALAKTTFPYTLGMPRHSANAAARGE
ncbi:MAG: hypothetical protein JO141_00730 [Bradyrhizobium sp.]|nr:hypothetical protein [Bradyrhizobium sp.]